MPERPFTNAPHSEAEAAVRALLHQIRAIIIAELEQEASAQGLEGDSVAAWLDPLLLPVRRPA